MARRQGAPWPWWSAALIVAWFSLATGVWGAATFIKSNGLPSITPASGGVLVLVLPLFVNFREAHRTWHPLVL